MGDKKTIFILGAGASASAKIPTQAGLLPLIFSINRKTFEVSSFPSDFLSIEIDGGLQRIAECYEKFDSFRRTLGEFIVINFASEQTAARYLMLVQYADSIIESSVGEQDKRDTLLFQAYSIVRDLDATLEDIFTIFDSVAAGRQHFRLYSPQKMDDIHQMLKMCIIYALSVAISTDCDVKDYDDFCRYLLDARLKSAQKEDPLSVVTTNWDDLLEQRLFHLCGEYNNKQTREANKIYPDLCFYNYDLSNSTKHVPSTHVKARGYRNIKVLKMHGSLAWLECPRCGRIFTDFSDEIAAEEFSNMPCPFCKQEQRGHSGNPKLRNLIITPTFLKSLDNLSLKNIWQNAYIDISEANHLVFIGYSLPAADFEMRCLLKKAIKKDTKITVVLRESSNPEVVKKNFVDHGFSEEEAIRLIRRMDMPVQRYISFFGEGRVEFFYNGFGDYIKSIRG